MPSWFKPHKYSSVVQEWRNVGGKDIYFRSGWEWKYAVYLQWLKDHGQIALWVHEPKTFWFEEIKRGVRSYLPDFWVQPIQNEGHPIQNEGYYVEVKGHYDAKSLTKIKRFRKYYPQEKLVLIDSEWFKDNSKQLSILCPEINKKA